MVLKTFVLLIYFLIATSNVQSQPITKVSFIPHWLPQAQFAGYYVAYELGIYKKYGIDLTILTGGPKISSAQLLQKGEVDFASLWLSNAIQLRAKGSRIVNLAQLVNRSALMLISKKSSGIKTPQDMNGKKIGIWGGDFQIQPMAFFKKFNLNVKTIMQGNSINLFFFDGIDVTTAMLYNEYNTIVNSGINKDELNTFFFSDYGLNFPEEGIYCSEEFYKSQNNLCEAFVNATLEGWKYSFDHPTQAIEIIIKYIKKENLSYNKAHQFWMLEKMKDLIFPSKKMDGFEKLSLENYLFVGSVLIESGLIKDITSFDSFYKPVKLWNAK